MAVGKDQNAEYSGIWSVVFMCLIRAVIIIEVNVQGVQNATDTARYIISKNA